MRSRRPRRTPHQTRTRRRDLSQSWRLRRLDKEDGIRQGKSHFRLAAHLLYLDTLEV